MFGAVPRRGSNIQPSMNRQHDEGFLLVASSRAEASIDRYLMVSCRALSLLSVCGSKCFNDSSAFLPRQDHYTFNQPKCTPLFFDKARGDTDRRGILPRTCQCMLCMLLRSMYACVKAGSTLVSKDTWLTSTVATSRSINRRRVVSRRVTHPNTARCVKVLRSCIQPFSPTLLQRKHLNLSLPLLLKVASHFSILLKASKHPESQLGRSVKTTTGCG